MASDESIWYRIGHAVERARQSAPPRQPGSSRRADAADPSGGDGSRGALARRPHVPSSDELMSAGIALVVDKALGGRGRRSSPGVTGLLRAAAAGAVAALLADLVRPLLRDDADLPGIDRDTAEHMLAGLGQGLIYGGVVEPRVPGPALVKGALFGSLEYAVHPLGGLSGLLGPHTPQRRIPFFGDILSDLGGEDRAYLEHLVFGIALALIYESSPSSNGIRSDEE